MVAQSPQSEVAERVAEAAPALVTAAHMEALQQLRQANADYRKRTADSHRWHAKALGMETSTVEGEPVGNMILTGDVYGSDAAEILRSLQGVAPSTPAATAPESVSRQPTPAATSSVPAWVKGLLVAGSLLGSGGIGAGVPWLLGAYDQPAASSTNTTIVQPGNDLGIEVVPGGAVE